MKSLYEETKQKLTAVLNEEQLASMEELKPKRHSHRRSCTLAFSLAERKCQGKKKAFNEGLFSVSKGVFLAIE